MNIPQNCHYTDTHEWVRLEGGEAIVGITDFAQGELGDVVYVELPEVDSEVSAMDEVGMIDSAKTTSPIMSPVSGKVTRINEELADHPELVNQAPYEEGWLFAIKPDDQAQIESLLDSAAYRKHLEDSGH